MLALELKYKSISEPKIFTYNLPRSRKLKARDEKDEREFIFIIVITFTICAINNAF